MNLMDAYKRRLEIAEKISNKYGNEFTESDKISTAIILKEVNNFIVDKFRSKTVSGSSKDAGLIKKFYLDLIMCCMAPAISGIPNNCSIDEVLEKLDLLINEFRKEHKLDKISYIE